MSQGRKASVDSNRRTTQKSHIPYRADDLGHGKKTGVTVDYVDHNSDDFEPFEKVLTQADVVTPPHKRGRKKKRPTSPMEEFDEDGEMSMELDDTNPDSPHQYFNNAPRPSAPSSANRSSSSARPGNRSSLVDYDRVPSPRATAASSRMRNGTTPQKRPMSRLSEVVPSPESPAQQYDDFDGGDYGEPLEPESSSPQRNRSFTQMDEEDDEEVNANNTRTISSPNVSSRTIRGAPDISDNPEIDDQQDGMDGMDGGEMSQEEEIPEQRVSTKPAKKRAAEEHPKKANMAKRQRMQENRALIETTSNVDGIRRGTRTRYKPLEWWRCEKVVYGRRDSGVSMVPVIKDIIRVPKEPPKALASKSSKRGRAPRSKSKQLDNENEDSREVVVYNPEEGWDDKTDPHGIVLDYISQLEVKRRVAFTSKMVTPKPAANNEFMFQKIFGDGDFIAAGQLIIPVGGKKPSKGTKDNTYIFYVIEGGITVKIHRTTFVLATGAMFIIPRGNNYYLENVSQRPAKLFFAQARKVAAGEEEMPPEIHSSPRRSAEHLRKISGASATTNGEPTSATTHRSSSIAAPTKPKSKVSGSRANSAAA